MEQLENELNVMMAKMNDKEVKASMANDRNICPQHRNETTETRGKLYDKTQIFEGQIMITNENIDSIAQYEVESSHLRQAIIEQFEN